jgi:hypothetical protein
MLRHITNNFFPYSKFLTKRFVPVSDLLETKKICEICKKELKNDTEKEEYLDVDNADREEFSNKWNLPRNSP